MEKEADRLSSLKSDTHLGAASGTSVNKVHHQPPKQHSQGSGGKNQQHSKPRREKPKSPPSGTPPSPCWGCGGMHYLAQCPFKDKQCPDCQRPGHKSGYCAAFKVGNDRRNGDKQRKRVSVVKISSADNGSSGPVDNASVTVNAVRQPLRKFIECNVNKQLWRFQCDCAADVTTLSEAGAALSWRSLPSTPWTHSQAN